MRVVLDTNVYIAALLTPYGVPWRVLELWYEGQYELVISQPVFAELQEVLGRKKFAKRIDPLLSDALLEDLKRLATWVRLKAPANVSVRDPKDLMVLGTALGGKARFIVTGDEDMLVLRSFRGIRILTPKEALEVIRGR
ncbi:putative toxin-antitoxin system toxin component, PIN family [Marinithermus hydrothermalis]|uniref:PIN domain-containing protein n=1 Tax=Marinithermus hydrothermalis (strain DSM 14884 / JCM 11576 / T1) TaxID=869210 RepID=F2NNQ5_MARHT|nr:putative toxin-antitoxin system toxin component, PIN family [Marinithermus hydrothermalis]AEB11279.1 protein of unknown function DUF132 [Marinithermus hydrothermalis DSM 14884]